MCIKPSLQKGKIRHIYTNVKCDVFSQEILCSMLDVKNYSMYFMLLSLMVQVSSLV